MDPFTAQLASQGINILGSYLSGGMKGRPQWGDLQFMNDATNRLWPDEITRQGRMVRDMAPWQADAHNTFQDRTFLQNVGRETAGIKQMAGELGMNPWELTGQSGSAMPMAGDPQGGGAQNPMGGFLQGIIPLQQTKMQNQAMLQGKMMDNLTQLKLKDIDQGGEITITDPDTGKTYKMGRMAAANIDNLKDQAAKARAEGERTSVGTVVDLARALWEISEQYTIDILGNKITGRAGQDKIADLLGKAGVTSGDVTETLQKATENVAPSELAQIKKQLLRAVGAIADAAKGVMDFGEEAGKVLKDPGQYFLDKLGNK